MLFWNQKYVFNQINRRFLSQNNDLCNKDGEGIVILALRTLYIKANLDLRPVHMDRFTPVCKFAYICKSVMQICPCVRHLLPYAKFARMQKLENLHLPQTKCKSQFAYTQNLVMCIQSKFCICEYSFNCAV